jgi:hypothetical protein
VRTTVDLAEIQYKPLPARSRSYSRSDIDELHALSNSRVSLPGSKWKISACKDA